MKKSLTFFATIVLFAFFASFTACTSSPSIDPSTDSSTDEKSSPELGVSALFAQYSLDSESFDLSEEKATFIYNVLLHTEELYSHNLGGDRSVLENEVWTNEDGREFVYDSEGNLVEDCMNQGSYNYYHFATEPLLHFAYDTLPWLELGNCAEDSSSKEERVTAFTVDFLMGMSYVFADEVEIIDIDTSEIKGTELDPVKRMTYDLFAKILMTEDLQEYSFDLKNINWLDGEEDAYQFSVKISESIRKSL